MLLKSVKNFYCIEAFNMPSTEGSELSSSAEKGFSYCPKAKWLLIKYNKSGSACLWTFTASLLFTE